MHAATSLSRVDLYQFFLYLLLQPVPQLTKWLH